MTPSNSGLTPAHLKWIVVCVLGVAFMFIFKDDLSDMIKGAEKISIGPEGVSIVTKTVKTPLGETIVSGPPTLATAGITQQSSPNYQSQYGYAINWPQDGSWSLRPDISQTLNLDLFIAYNKSWGDFVPNVNVTIEPSFGMSIREWFERSNPMVSLMGFTVTDVQIDDASNSGVRIVHGNYFGLESNQIQRVILAQGYAYIATATRPVALSADPQLWQDLNEILNSFRAETQ